jgi:hypothetical protein
MKNITTKERYLKQLRAAALTQGNNHTLPETALNAWAQSSLNKLEAQGRLVSEQQYLDQKNKRVLAQGDRAKYIGPDRVEHTEDGAFTRVAGQLGTVQSVQNGPGNTFIVTWRPDSTAATTHVVELVVRTGTSGYFTLERVPNAGMSDVSGSIPADIPA